MEEEVKEERATATSRSSYRSEGNFSWEEEDDEKGAARTRKVSQQREPNRMEATTARRSHGLQGLDGCISKPRLGTDWPDVDDACSQSLM